MANTSISKTSIDQWLCTNFPGFAGEPWARVLGILEAVQQCPGPIMNYPRKMLYLFCGLTDLWQLHMIIMPGDVGGAQ